MRCRTTIGTFLAVGCAGFIVQAQTPPPAPAAPPSPAPAPPATGSPPPAGGAPAPAPGATPDTAPTTPPKAPEGGPPPEYYVETPQAAPGTQQQAPAQPQQPPPGVTVYEPPPPGGGPVFEPPPPPVPRHVAPKTSFWLGARLGWFVPFGNVYARNIQVAPYQIYEGVPWSDFASSGPMFEVDVGMRISRNYNVFALWERAQLGSGNETALVDGVVLNQDGGDTDFWGIGLRASSNADKVGFLTEFAFGYRRARTTFDDGSEIQFTDGLLEGRLGIGADIRLSPLFSVTPLLTLGVGSFGDIEYQYPNGDKVNAFGPNDQGDGHAWFTANVGGHFDLAGSK